MIRSSGCPQWPPEPTSDPTEDRRSYTTRWGTTITSLHEPEKFILAIVSVNGGFAHAPRYVRGPLVEREPSFLETAIQFDLRRLLERAREPA